MAKAMGINRIECQNNSEPVVQKCNITRDTLDPNMKAWRQVVDKIGGYLGFGV
jgi:hypothetical protein